MPSRPKLTSDIEQSCNKLIDKIKDSLSSARRVSITTDCWSGKNSVDNYIGVTTSFFDTRTKEKKCLNIGKFIVVSDIKMALLI